jgi:gluconolactonase
MPTLPAPLRHAPLTLVCSLLTVGCVTSHPSSPLAKGAKPVQLDARNAGEGPVWSPEWNTPANTLFFVGDSKISRFTAGKGSRIFRDPVKGANGLLIDPRGRILTTEAGNRRVTRTEKDGSITVLAASYHGQKFNGPNDLCMDSKERVYFTDPRYGNRDNMELTDERGEKVEGVYRIDGPGKVQRILGRESVNRPNGILVSPDDAFLYVADNNNTEGGVRKLWRFVLRPDGTADPGSRTLIFDWKTSRGPDGLKMDMENRIYVAGGLNKANPPHETAKPYTGGVYILSEKGRLLDFIPIPVDEVTNCAFGDRDMQTLFITAGGTLWSIRVNTPGRPTAPFSARH